MALLREHFDVDLGFERPAEELAERIGDYDGILIRSATKLTADLIERADRLSVVGRAGVGVDNVDVEAATRRGIVVANAPESNVVTAAEHTMAPAAGARAQHPRGVRVADRRTVGALQVLRRRALREDARRARLRADRPARRPACPRLRHARARVRPLRERGALPRARRREGRAGLRHLRAVGFHHRPPAQDPGDAGLPRRRGVRRDARRRPRAERRARRADRRTGASATRWTRARSRGRRSTSSPASR